MAWLNNVPLAPALVPMADGLSQDIHARRDECLAKLRRCGLSDPQSAGLLDRLFEAWAARSRLVPCHNDIYPQHILVDKSGGLGIIDWDDAAANDPIRDFGFWYEPFDDCQVFCDSYPLAWQAACRAYRVGFPSPEEDHRLKLYALAGEFAYDDDPQGMHVAHWLRRYGQHFDL